MNGFSAADMSTAAANGFRDGLAAQPGVPGIDLRNAILQLQEDALHMKDPGDTVNAYNRVLALIDASPKGGSDETLAYWRVTFRMYRDDPELCVLFVGGQEKPTLDSIGVTPRPIELVNVEPRFVDQNRLAEPSIEATPSIAVDPSAEVTPAASATDWRVKAAEWLEEQAIEQESTNKAYPAHVAAYPSWADRVHWIRTLASKVSESQATRAEVGA